MNRRNLLLGLLAAPFAPDVLARAAAAPAVTAVRLPPVAVTQCLNGNTVIHGSTIVIGTITADRIVAGSIAVNRITLEDWRQAADHTHINGCAISSDKVCCTHLSVGPR